jgi:hypothetical protein
MTEAGSLDRSYRLHALVCTALLLGCALATRPFAEIGISDDFSYIRSAEVLAQTGHIVYNGVANPILGWQLYLGAVFIKLFGFSFTTARAPILMISVATTYLLQRVMARFGLSPASATLGTLTVMLSPSWFILTEIFMTDAAGLFALVLCFYGCQRAVLARDNFSAVGWLCLAGLTDIVGGTARQIAWLGVLVLVPATAWLLRRRKGVLLSGALLWVIGIAAIAICSHWFLEQPYTLKEKMIQNSSGSLVHASTLASVARTMLRTLPSLPLLAMPVMMIFTQGMLRLGRRIVTLAVSVICAGAGLCLAATYFLLHRGVPPEKFLPPWLGYNWTVYGIMQGVEIAGHPAVVLSPAYQFALVLGVILCSVCVIAQVATAPARTGHTSSAAGPVSASLTWKESLALLTPFSVAYFALLLPRATDSTASDRYLIPLVIVMVVVLLRVAQQRSLSVSYWAGVVTLILFSIYAVAGTHDQFSFERARVQAAQQVMDAGVPRASIEGGWEFDGWTQIVTQGYLDDSRLQGVKHSAGRPDPNHCHGLIYAEVPMVQPVYQLAFSPEGCFARSQFPAVTFYTWLPPYRQKIYTQKVFQGGDGKSGQ